MSVVGDQCFKQINEVHSASPSIQHSHHLLSYKLMPRRLTSISFELQFSLRLMAKNTLNASGFFLEVRVTPLLETGYLYLCFINSPKAQ